jgi:Domain of unknown function (DUF1931)
LTCINATPGRHALSCEIVSTALEGATMTMMGVTRFERFFRAAAGLGVDKQDLKRYSDFVNHKIYDLLVRGQATAKANGRDVIDPHDLPITKGLQECIHAFTKLDGEIELKSIVDHITARPPLDLAIRDETEARLAAIAGGLSVALARAFKLINPAIKKPATEDWERATQIFDLLL